MAMTATDLRRLVALLTEAAGLAHRLADAAETPPAIAGIDPRGWYLARVEHLLTQGRTSSREQDHLEALASGLCLTRDEVRALRAELAPAAWRKPGRPRLVTAA